MIPFSTCPRLYWFDSDHSLSFSTIKLLLKLLLMPSFSRPLRNNSMMPLTTFYLIPFLSLMVTLILAEDKVTYMNLLMGSKATIVCQSSYPPPWTKMSNGGMKIIAVSGKKHANWKEPRFAFGGSGSDYSVTISDVQLQDKGTYTCGGDKPVSFVVSVIR